MSASSIKDIPKVYAAYLRLAVANELNRLNVTPGVDNAPFGGWRSQAVFTVAEREGLNPYKMDRMIREEQA